MELSNLVFTATTTDLERASKVIAGLVTDVSKLDKASRDAAKTEEILAKAAKLNADAHLQNAKAQDVRLKSTIAADKADKANEQSVVKKTKAIEKETEATAKNVGVLQKQKDILEFQTQGYSKGQAGILAYGKAAGLAASDIAELGKVLETQRKLMGVDPFDKSLSGIKSLQNQYTELKESLRQYNTDSELTAKQTRELARDKERLIEKMKVEGASFVDVRKAVRAHNDEYVSLAGQYNKLSSAEDAVVKSRKEMVQATNYLTTADQKMSAALSTTNAALDKAGTDSLVKYETALRKSGVSQDVATQRLAKYKVQLEQVQKAEAARSEQFLARALMPQVTDVAVSLWSGQNPLTVLLQQGGQAVDLFNQSGVAAEKFGETVKKSMAAMLPSILVVAKGVGGLIVDGFVSAGKAANDFLARSVGVSGALDAAWNKASENGPSQYAGRIAKLSTGLTLFASVSVAAAVVALGGLVVALAQVTKEQNELVKSLNLTGASLGLSADGVVKFAQSIQGVKTTEAISFIQELSKTGAKASTDLAGLTKVAVDLEKYGGVALKDTAKAYDDLQSKPFEGLMKLAEGTGQVSQETVDLAVKLKLAGDEVGLLRLANDQFIAANGKAVDSIKAEINPMTALWITVKDGISFAWEGLKNFARTGVVLDTFIASLRVIATGALAIGAIFRGLGKTIALAFSVYAQTASAMNPFSDTTKEQAVKNIQGVFAAYKDDMSDWKKGTDAAFNDIWNKTEKTTGLTDAARAANSAYAASSVKGLGDLERAYNSIEKSELKKLTRQQAINKAIEDYTQKNSQASKYQLDIIKQGAGISWDKVNKNSGKQGIKDLETEIDLRNEKLGLLASFNNELDKIERRRAKSGDEDQYQKSLNALIEKQPIYLERQKEINAAHDLTNKLFGKADMLGKDYYKTLEQINKEEASGLRSPENAERARQAAFDQTELAKTRLKIEQDSTKLAEKYRDDIEKSQNASALETANLDDRLALLGLTSEQQKNLRIEQERRNKLLAIALKLQTQEQEVWDKWGNGDFGVDGATKAKAVIKELTEQAGVDMQNVNKEIAVKFREDFDAELKQIKSGVTDSIVTALFEGGKAGSKSIREFIVAKLKDPIKVYIEAFVNSIIGGGDGGSPSSFMQSVSSGKSFIDSLNGSLTSSISTGFSKFASSSMGQSLGLSNSTAVVGNNPSAFVPAGGNLTSFGSAMQGAMASAAGIAAGLALNKAISGGYSVGKGMDNWQKVGTVIAGAINPALGAIVGAVAGVFNKAFGRKLTETGIQGTFGGESGFTGEGYKFEKGGWFRSDKTTTSDIDPALQQGLAQQFTAIKSSIGLMAVMLGQGTDAISNFTASIKVNFKDLSEEEATKKLQEEFDKVTESLAGLALGTTQYNRTGETNIQTLTRLHTSLLTANSALSVLGGYMFDVSLAGAAASQTLVDLMGGVEQFTTTLSGYYDNFYTEEERTAKATENLTKEFDKLGIKMPEISNSTREWYRSEVERLGAMDLSIEANAKAYASILSLQGAVNKLAPAFDTTKEETNTFLAGLLSTTSDLEIELLVAQGKQSEATALRRAIETKGFNAAEIAAYDYNARLRESITATLAASAALKAYKAAAISIATSKDTIAGVVRSPVEVAQNSLNKSLSDLNNLLKPASIVKDDYTYLSQYKDVFDAFVLETAKGAALAGMSQQDYADMHYKSSGKTEGRMSPQELLDLVTTLTPNFNPLTLEDVLGLDVSNQGTYSEEQWGAIAEVFAAKANLVNAGNTLTGTNTTQPDTTVVTTETLDLAKVLQDYNRALLEAQGNTSGLEAFDKAISDAALITEGWTQLQIDAVDAAREVTKVANATKEFNRALLEAQGDTAGLAAFDKAISDAALLTQGWTQLQIDTVDAARNSKQAIEDQKNSLQIAFDALSKAVDAEKSVLQKQIDIYSKSVNTLSELFNTLSASVKELYGTVDSTTEMQYNQGREFIKSAAATAASTGVLPINADLQDALSAVKSGNVLYATKFEKDLAALTLASDLSLMEKISKSQLTEAEFLLKANQDQLIKLDEILENARAQLSSAQAQLDATITLNTSVLSVVDALNNFASALAVPKRVPDPPRLFVDVFPKPPPTTLPTYTGGSTTSDTSSLQGYTSVGGGLYQVGNEIADAATIAQLIAISAGMPKFADGINNVPYDMTARIHKGEAIIPEQFNPFNPNAAMNGLGSNSEMIQELKSLRTEVQMLRVEARATAISTSKINNNLERSIVPTQDGDALLVKTTT